jgi:hypothetical protein
MLVTKHCQIDTSKLQVKCKGPHRIVSVDSDYVCVCVCGVANLLTKELEAAHAIRLRFYQDKDLNITAHMSKAA